MNNKLLTEIEDSLKDLIVETDEKYNKFLNAAPLNEFPKIARGHYKYTYNGFSIDVSQVGKNWYATVDTGTDYELQDQLSAMDINKKQAFESAKYHIDNYLLTKNNINETVLNEQVYKVYHGTNQVFDKFDFNKATQGIVWFTDSIDSIKNQEHGGQGSKIIMTRYITINNPAGWEQYEKYGLQQLEDMGYDGVILPQEGKNDFFVFSNKQIRKNP